MAELLRDLYRRLRRDRLRTFLTLLGIVLGAASLCFLGSALTAGLESLSRTSQRISGDDVQRIRSQPPAFEQQFRTARRLSSEDERALSAHEGLPAAQVQSASKLFGQNASAGQNKMKIGIQSGGTSYARLSNLELLEGRWLDEEEEKENACLLGFDVWQKLFGGVWPLRDNRVLVNDALRLRVVGVLKRRPTIGASGGDGTWMYDRKIFVGSPYFARNIEQVDEPYELALRYDPIDHRLPDRRETALRLSPYLQNLHLGVRNFVFDALRDDDEGATEALIIWGLSAILFAAGIVSMIVGGVNVMNASLVTLHERTKEFGIRRALGASARHLSFRVLFEAALISSIGGVLGVGIGLASAYALSVVLAPVFLYWPFVIVDWSVAAALGSSLGVGILAGLVPAIRAGQILPAECLRAE